MRVLHIERDGAVAASLALILAADGVKVDPTDCAEDGIDLAKHYDYDLIVLEPVGLAVDGARILRRLRDAKVSTPVLVLTSAWDVEGKVRLLDSGADDVLTKPFHPAELKARIGALARRGRGHANSVVRVGDLEIRLDQRMASAGGMRLHATAKEFAILEALALRKGAVLTKEMLLSHLYGGLDEPEMKIIDVFVCKLRKKIAALLGHGVIETVWGRGYMLRDPVIGEAGRHLESDSTFERAAAAC